MPYPQSILREIALQGLKNSGRGIPQSPSPIPGFDQSELGSMDPSVQNELYRDKFRNEAINKAERGYRTGDQNEVSSNLFALKSLGQDYAASPLRQQEADVEATSQADQEGFDDFNGIYNPQAAKASYMRGLETRKVDSPVRAAEIAATSDRDVANIHGRTQEKVANIQTEPYRMQQERLNNPNFLQGLQDMSGGNGSPLTGFSSSPRGATSFRFATPAKTSNPNINPLQLQVTAALQALGDIDPWDISNANDPAVKTYKTAVGQLIASTPDTPEVKMDAQKWLNKQYSDPDEADLNRWDTSDPHVMAVLNLIRRVRGL